MMLPDLMATVILLVLVAYVLMAGADFGGGVWDLLAGGPRAARHREAIAHAIGPIWEANHVWMIVAVVLLFTCFPLAFSVVMTALHVPIALMLVGIVLRGSSFVFRKADPAGEGGPGGWQTAFAASSLLTPIMIGVVAGAVSTPAIGVEEGVVTGGFFAPWLAPFPWAVGALTLALFAFLAAFYLPPQVEEEDLREDFRARALGTAVAVAVTGAVAALMVRGAAPHLASRLLGTGGGLAILVSGAASLVGATILISRRRWYAARALAALTAAIVVGGWGWGLSPWLVTGAVQIRDSAAPDVTLRLVGGILAGGSLLLVPAFAYLYATFHGHVFFPRRDRE